MRGSHSENFWAEHEDICFAFGNVYEKSVVYATVADTGRYEDMANDELVIECTETTKTYLGSSSSSFDLEDNEYMSFWLEVSQGTNEIVCTTEGSNGDIDLYMKVGNNLLASGFDCVEDTEDAAEF